MSKPNKRKAERRKKKIGSSKEFAAKKAFSKAVKKQSKLVKKNKKGHTPKKRKILSK